MKVLMIGWEFPPHSYGGLGVACYCITRALAAKNVKVTMILPMNQELYDHDFLEILSTDAYAHLEAIPIESAIVPYIESYADPMNPAHVASLLKNKSLYGGRIEEKARLYALSIASYIKVNKEKFKDIDVIHAHDWLTFEAALAAKRILNKPLVIHIHATEYDRSANMGRNEHVYQIERKTIAEADRVIAISKLIENRLITQYNADPGKIRLVYNAAYVPEKQFEVNKKLSQHKHVVLFLGRLTVQKGPEFFVKIAKRVVELIDDILFIFAGSGELFDRLVNYVSEMGLSDRFLFLGQVSWDQTPELYSLADVYVFPSVSEPFGLTPLEAIHFGLPVVMSKQTGVAETVSNVCKADFWDIDEMAHCIISLLKYSDLSTEMKNNAKKEIETMTWDKRASQYIDIYKEVQ